MCLSYQDKYESIYLQIVYKSIYTRNEIQLGCKNICMERELLSKFSHKETQITDK